MILAETHIWYDLTLIDSDDTHDHYDFHLLPLSQDSPTDFNITWP